MGCFLSKYLIPHKLNDHFYGSHTPKIKSNLFTVNILHDILFVVFSSMFAGDYETSLNYALIIKEEIDEKETT